MKTMWSVRLTRCRRRVKLEAEYHVIEAGCIKFRNTRRNAYPENVIAFAAGEWVSVENLSIPVATKDTL